MPTLYSKDTLFPENDDPVDTYPHANTRKSLENLLIIGNRFLLIAIFYLQDCPLLI